MASLTESNSANFAATLSPVVTLSSVASGALLAAGCSYSTTGKNISSVSDTSGNSWAEAGTSDIFCALNAAGAGSTVTVTLTLNATATGIVWVAEFAAASGSWAAVDGGNTPNAGSSATIDPTDFTPAEANELVVVNLTWLTGSRNLNPRPTSGWTAVLGAKHLNTIAADPLFRTNLPASPVTDTFPLSATSAWGASLAAVREAAAGQPTRLRGGGVPGLHLGNSRFGRSW